VTLFEADRELGGVLRTGIPSYRLPRDVLDRELNRILDRGVTVTAQRRVSKSDLLDFSHEFAAVFVATGLQEARSLDLGQLSPGVVTQGIGFLDRARRGSERLTGEHVVVIGGGNTAIDSARTARRLGALSVRVVYRRTRDEMPAIKEEIDEALEENIILDELVSPVRLREDGVGMLLTCNRMRLGEPDESGRRRPVPEVSEDAYFDIRCDRVILALGQSNDLSILPEGSAVHEGKNLLGLTGAPVFGCGDFATNEGTVAAAIGSGRRAAWHMHKTLTGEDLFPPPEAPVATPEQMTMHVFKHVPGKHGEVTPPTTRRHSFVEVRRGLMDDLGEHPAVEEAQRCFSCGVCNSCDRCVSYCPEGILVRDSEGYRFDYDYCKGCGICASQCPRGVVYMAEI
jgi:NADPH-dependent glutamate synthase beta subunit-like oxidoreductase/Pyruvate/2-oxoacid:ferredoxin oxidoreductase delta subunit